jgi:hypothetical protein
MLPLIYHHYTSTATKYSFYYLLSLLVQGNSSEKQQYCKFYLNCYFKKTRTPMTHPFKHIILLYFIHFLYIYVQSYFFMLNPVVWKLCFFGGCSSIVLQYWHKLFLIDVFLSLSASLR